MPAIEPFLVELLAELASPGHTDHIQNCGTEALQLLNSEPRQALNLAGGKLRVWPFKDVELRWRRLFEDSSFVIAAQIVLKHLGQKPAARGHEKGIGQASGEDRKGFQKEEPAPFKRKLCEDSETTLWLPQVIQLLDMAIIMTGAPRRHAVITEFFSMLESHLTCAEESGDHAEGPPSRRRRGNDESISIWRDFEFATSDLSYRAPAIHHHPGYNSDNRSERPHLLRDAIDHWPALAEPQRRWAKPQYLLLRTLGGRRLVPVEIGRSYTDEDWGQKIMTFGEFMNRWILRDERPLQEIDAQRPEEERIGYLAQHDLLSQVPALRNDIAIPDAVWERMDTDSESDKQCSPPSSFDSTRQEAAMTEPIINTWFGPAGTITPLHTDSYDNILCQVVGKKYIRLYSPKETARMFPRGMESQEVCGADGVVENREIDMSNTSSIPADVVEMGPAALLEEVVEDEADADASANKWEGFEKAPYFDLVLEEGQALFIPCGWWHYVRSLTVSFSVSFWWK